jgi:hypothetical protein
VTDQTASPEPAASWWEDYLEIFFAPSRVFARREKSGFLLPLVILTVVSGVLVVGLKGSFAPAFEADITRQMEIVQQNNPQITAEQLEQGRAMQGTMGTVMFVVMMPILALVIGLTLWLFGKFVGATETLSQAMLIAAFASFPRIVYLLAGGIQGLVMPEESLNGMSRLSLGPARFLDPDTASAIVSGSGVPFRPHPDLDHRTPGHRPQGDEQDSHEQSHGRSGPGVAGRCAPCFARGHAGRRLTWP